MDQNAYLEKKISQEPALQVLKALGYTYITPEDCEKQRGSRYHVLLKDILREDGIEIRGIYERSDAKVRLQEGMERTSGFIGEPFDTKVAITENGIRYLVDVREGQKTGFFLD